MQTPDHPDLTACARCGTRLSPRSMLGLCPRCLAAQTLNSLHSPDGPTLGLPMPTPDTPPAFEVNQRFGGYEILEEIARGGMGVVLKARQVSLDRVVALKLVVGGGLARTEFLRRFQVEAQAAASLRHPNIIPIHEIGSHEGHPYFSMDFIEGRNLSQVAKDSPLPPHRAARILERVAEAVHYAHGCGVIHRDLKPSNVILDGEGTPHLTDFGLAKRVTGSGIEGQGLELTHSGQVLGTPTFMSPEQVRGERGGVGVPSDVWSLGAMLYFLLTGRPPFEATTLAETLDHVLKEEPTPPRLLGAAVPRDLQTIYLKCLEKEPARRYASARELAEDLRCFLGGQPIRARAIHPAEHVWRSCRRHPSLAVLWCVLVALAVGASWTAFHLRRLNREMLQDVYFMDVSQAQKEWEGGNAAMTQYHLERQIPAGNAEDLREFEWRHLWWLCQGDPAFRLPTVPQAVGSLAFSADGRLVAGFTWDTTNALHVWNVAERREIFRSSEATSFGGFSADHSTLVVGYGDGSVRLVDPLTGVVRETIPGVGDVLVMSGSGRSILALGTNQTLSKLDLVSGKVTFRVEGAARRFFDYGRGAPVALSWDGNRVAVVDGGRRQSAVDHQIRLWDAVSAQELPPLQIQRQVRAILFSPDGGSLALGDGSGAVSLWDLTTRHERVIPAHTQPVQALAFAADGATLASGSTDQSIRLWDAVTLEPKGQQVRGQMGAVSALAFSPDSGLLASGTRNGPVLLWSMAGPERTDSVEGLISDNYGNFVFSPDSRLVAGGCRDGKVRVWDVATLALRFELPGSSYVFTFSADSTRLLVATARGEAQWWNLNSGTLTPVPQYGGFGHISCATAFQDRKLAALGHDSGTITVLEIDTGLTIATLNGHKDAVTSLAFSPDGYQLASGGRDQTLRIWDVGTQTGTAVCPEHRGSVLSVAFSQDSKTLISGCGAATIKFWRIGDWKQSIESISRHESAIRSLAFSHDGRTVASGSEDRSVKLWSTTQRRELASFKHPEPIRQVAFSPDDTVLCTVTDRGTLRLFRAVPRETLERR